MERTFTDKQTIANGVIEEIKVTLPPGKAESLSQKTKEEVPSSDRYGRALIYRTEDNKVCLRIIPPYPQSLSNQKKSSDISIDLSPLGQEYQGKTLESIVRQDALPAQQKRSKVSVIAPYKLSNTTEEKQFLEHTVSGAQRFENLLGLTPGSLLNRLMVRDEDSDAGYAGIMKGTIEVSDENEELRTRENFLCGFHEATHNFDQRYLPLNTNGETLPHTKAIWKKATDKFSPILTKLKEDAFAPDEVTNQGHPADDKSEFFATLMTSTFAVFNWEERMESHKEDKIFLTDYKESLEAIQKDLHLHRLSSAAPIHKALDHRISHLDRMLKELAVNEE